jgi:hypothetical protein
MTTTTSTRELNIREEEQADIIVVHYEPGVAIPGKFAQFMRRPLKVFGFVSTAAWTVAALAPNTFNVPQNFRGWFFVIWVFWFFGYCAGLFNL